MREEYVVLLHGLGRTQLSMALPQLRLRAAGFTAVNVGYPSRHHPIEELARFVTTRLEDRIGDSDKAVHFLTHSMGGIVLRTMLSRDPPALRLGGVVMLAPPNRGSRLAGRLSDSPLFRATLGPAARQLRDGTDGIHRQLGPANFDVGVIAGSKAVSPWSFLLTKESDGTLTIDETTLEGMTDFLVVPRSHTFIMNDPTVIDQAIHFFRHGQFKRADDPTGR